MDIPLVVQQQVISVFSFLPIHVLLDVFCIIRKSHNSSTGMPMVFIAIDFLDTQQLSTFWIDELQQ